MGSPDTIIDTFTSFEAEEEHAELVYDPREQDFGRYRLCYQLAAGGMATVFLARAIGPGGVERLVAIKRIHQHLARRRALVEMFLDEARIASRINHPNVCMVLDFGEHQGAYFLAMEYLLGEPLNRVASTVAKRPDLLDARRWRAVAARIIADAAEGLYAAHRLKDEHGRPLEVVHRDVSLHNLFVTYAGVAKILDFGIAKAATQVHQTHSGSFKGTYAYMAPEQFVGGEVDSRTDIWGLGVCLWELCAGTRLFRRESQMQTMLAVCSDPIPLPQTVQPNVPEELATIIMRALSRDREQRYPTARAMSQALGEYLRGSGERTGIAELEEWMAELFGAQRTTKLERVESVIAQGAPVSGSIHERATQLEGAAETTTSVVRLARPRLPPLVLWLIAAALPAAIALGVAATFLVMRLGEDDVPTASNGEVAAGPGSDGPNQLDRSPPAGLARPEPARPEEPVPAIATEVVHEEEPVEGDATPAAQVGPVRARPQPRTTTPEAAGFGHVNVSTPGGWAEIYEGGRLIGRSPRQIRLSQGRHLIELRPFGRAPGLRRTVQVPADRVVRLSVPVSGR